MENFKAEKAGRKRGKPKLDAHITEEYAPSRRQALNKMYMYEGVHLLSAAATEIQNNEVLWQEDRKAVNDVRPRTFAKSFFGVVCFRFPRPAYPLDLNGSKGRL